MDKFRQRVSDIITEVVDPEFKEIRRLFLTSEHKHGCDPDDLKFLRNLGHLIGDIKTEVKTIEKQVQQLVNRQPQDVDEDPQHYEGDNPRERLEDEIKKWWRETTNGDSDESPIKQILDNLLSDGKDPSTLLQRDGSLKGSAIKGLVSGAVSGLVSSLFKLVQSKLDKQRIENESAKVTSTIRSETDTIVEVLGDRLAEIKSSIVVNQAETIKEIQRVYDLLDLKAGEILRVSDKIDQATQNIDLKLDQCCQNIKARLIDLYDQIDIIKGTTKETNDDVKMIKSSIGNPSYRKNLDNESRQKLMMIYSAVEDIRRLL